MKVLRVYVDTSVLGGCFDREFELWSKGLMEDFQNGQFRAVLSDVTAAEVMDAPEPVRDVYADLLSLGAEVLPVTPEGGQSIWNEAFLERGSKTTCFILRWQPSPMLMSWLAGISVISCGLRRSGSLTQ